MLLLGMFLIVVSIFILYKRFILLFLGKSANGFIIGYGDPIKGIKGTETYSYKVKYEYNGKEYIASSLESVSVAKKDIPSKNIHKDVTVYFQVKKKEVVTIKEFKGTTIVGLVFLVLGILTIVLWL